MFISTFAQWNPTSMRGEKIKSENNATNFYSLDIKQLRSELSNAQETGKSAKPVIINMPTLEGKIEKFAVFSFPVMVKSLADEYNLGSYVGVGVDDPKKYIRFSVAPNDFQSMIIKDGNYQFIEPQNTDKSVYGVHLKTVATGDKPFLCSTSEDIQSKEDINRLYKNGNIFTNQPTDFSKSSDKKYRTYRLAISTTGEYTSYFGSVANAFAQINATMTRVNGVFENDFALHLIVQNFPALIYTNAATDPYSDPAPGSAGAWNGELMNNLHASPGDAAFDIGHLFGGSGGGGNAGCIGCICNNTLQTGGGSTNSYKGSGFTSPKDGKPFGDNFDIDYVVHEMGHQIGGNHTFSHKLENSGTNVEPGSGSTIMAYAGITNRTGQPITDVQAHSDAYFSVVNLIQIQANLATKTCQVETAIPNNPPVIAALPNYTIPKGTAFILTASATDPENDPLTYCWEEVDNATVVTNQDNLGTTASGPSFRSISPTSSPTRYFPALSSVLAGVLDNSLFTWESVSMVARPTKFRVTVRDNSASNPGYQQTQNALENITVANDGPFKILSAYVYNNSVAPLTWDVVNTSAAPYSVTNVKIDYTVNNGANWTVLSASTPNNGSQNYSFPTLANGSKVKVRVSSIGNIFYTIKELSVAQLPACDGTPPTNITFSSITSNSAKVSWDPISSATYVVRYRKSGTSTWTSVNTSSTFLTISNLTDNTQYETQVASVCSGTTGTFSASQYFTTLVYSYCANASGSAAYEYISKVVVQPTAGTTITSASGASTYTSYMADGTKLINLNANSTSNTLTVTKAWATATKYNESVFAWIDYNRDGIYDASEQIMATANNQTTPVQVTFSVPAGADTGGQSTGMRIILSDQTTQSTACAAFGYGEVEDYAVKITPTSTLSASENNQNKTIQVYPNPASDILNVTKVTNNSLYSIYNVAGQIVSKGKVSDNKVHVSQLVKGVYIISIDSDGETAKLKFIKK